VAIQQAELESRTTELSLHAFEAFGSDIASALGCKITESAKGVSAVAMADLKKQFKEHVAAILVQAEGALAGTFQLILGQEAFLMLAGALATLPDKSVMRKRKKGQHQNATDAGDAVAKVVNLLIGSWDRIFREELAGHGRFALNKIFIGNPWDNLEQTISLTNTSESLVILSEIQMKRFLPLTCAVIYPKELFEPKPLETTPPSSDVKNEITADGGQEPQTKEDDISGLTRRPDDADVPQAAMETPQTVAAAAIDTDSTINDAPSGTVFESIRKITQSPAALPGQSAYNTIGAAQALHSISAKNVMRKDVVWASSDETVEQVFAKMQQYNTNYVLVGQNGLLEGIISKSDIRGAMSPFLQEMFVKWRRPLDLATLQIRVKWVMSKPVHTILPDAAVASFVRVMCNQKIRSLPVVDANGAVGGIVTTFEIFNMLASIS
jgi:CBS domain-containing protein